MRTIVKSTILAALSAAMLAACGGTDSSAPAAQSKQQAPVQAQIQAQPRTQKTTAASYQQVVEELYIAYFGRPADPAGLVNFENALAAANAPTDIGSLASVYSSNPAVASLVNNFATSSESQALYGSGNATAFVTAVFNNVLGRQPQQQGIDFWVNAITNNGLNQADAALAIMAGGLTNTTAQGLLDTQLIKNRVSVASYFTAQLTAGGSAGSYAGAAAAQAARTMLGAVTASTDPTAYQANVNATIAALPAPPAAGTVIKTFAGRGDGDGGAATAAGLLFPVATAVDASGNLYFVELIKSRVRKVNASTGIVTTVAGNGTSGYSGDGGPGASASLRQPQGIALDSNGNLFIADTDNNVIREVLASNGNIYTYAGNGKNGYAGDGMSGSRVQFAWPEGVAVDAMGNVYVADTGNNRIRVITTIEKGYEVYTAAGNGTAGYTDHVFPTDAALNTPVAVAVDANGYVYVADYGNNAIRKFGGTELMSTIAGNGTAGYTGDNGAGTTAELNGPNSVAVDAAGDVYIVDVNNNRVRKLSGANGTIATVAGNATLGYAGDNGPGANAQLNTPLGVAVDAAGNAYIADSGNNRIRKLNAASSVISTVAGDGTDGFSGDNGQAGTAELYNPSGIAMDAAGNIYIADTRNDRIRKVSATTGVITTVAGTGEDGYTGDKGPALKATFSQPDSVAVDGAGNLYIADSGNYAIRKVNAATGIITTVAGNGTYGTSGNNGPGASAEIEGVWSIAADKNGNLYIADPGSLSIRKVNPATGIITAVAGNGTGGISGDNGPATSASLSNPYGVAIDGSNNIYIVDTLACRIRKVNAATGIITTVAGNGNPGYSGDSGAATSAELSSPTAAAVDGSGNLFIVDQSGMVVRKVNAATGVITTVAGKATAGYAGDGASAIGAEFSQITAVFIDASGNLYIADSGNDRIRIVAGAAAPTPLDQ